MKFVSEQYYYFQRAHYYLTMSTQQNVKEARAKRKSELEQELAELNLADIAEEVAEDSNAEYEEMLMLQPRNLAKGFKEALEFTTDFLKNTPNKQVEEILQYFNGATPTQQKKQLATFLKEFGCYRTKDFKKLRNRLFSLRYKGREVLNNGADEYDFYKYCGELGFKFD